VQVSPTAEAQQDGSVSDDILRTEGLSKSFGGVHAVEDVSLRIAERSLHAIIGPNGAGKTTLFHLMTGVYRPTRGRVYFRGQDVTARGAADRVKIGISRSYQRTNVFPHLSVRENLMLAAERSVGNSSSVCPRALGGPAHALASRVLSQLGLESAANFEAQTLPYGVQRLIDIGIALCCEPKLLLLDEPTSGLSSAELREAIDTLKVLRSHYTIVLIEHNMELVIGIADRASVLNFGRLIAEGTPEEIRRIPEVHAAYFGSRKAMVAP